MPDRLPPSWRDRITLETRAQMLLERRLGLCAPEALQIVRAYLRKRPVAFWLPDLAAVATFFGSMWVYGEIYDLLKDPGGAFIGR